MRPTLLYGCETWAVREADLQKLEVFDHWCMRIISRTRRSDRTSNDDERARCHDAGRLGPLLRKQRLQWLGKVARMDNTELAKQLLMASPCRGWKCRTGGQTKTWLSTIKEDMDILGLQNVYEACMWKSD